MSIPSSASWAKNNAGRRYLDGTRFCRTLRTDKSISHLQYNYYMYWYDISKMGFALNTISFKRSNWFSTAQNICGSILWILVRTLEINRLNRHWTFNYCQLNYEQNGCWDRFARRSKWVTNKTISFTSLMPTYHQKVSTTREYRISN